jgi:4-amino-4-deoxy-L-arabinose transferase-like glycosyltransferase
VLILLLPWSLFLPVAISRLRFWRPTAWRAPAGPGDLPLLALLWLVLMVAFFSAAATKLPGYILPAMPGGALLVGLLFVPFPAADSGSSAPLLALAALAAVLAPRWIGGDPAYPHFAEAIQASPLPLLLALPLAFGAAGLVWMLWGKGQPVRLEALWLPNALSFSAVLALVVPVLTPLLDRERQLPIRQLAQLAEQQAGTAEPLVVVGYKRYSVVFYSGRPVLFASSPQEVLQAVGSAPRSVLLLGSDHELLEFGIGPGDASLLGRRDAHALLRLPITRLGELGHP